MSKSAVSIVSVPASPTRNDQLSVLWDLTGPGATGSTEFGIMTFTGEFGAEIETELLSLQTTSGLFSSGSLRITGATQAAPAYIPLTASALLLLVGIGACRTSRQARAAAWRGE